MLLIDSIDNFDIQQVFYSDKVENNIMYESYFIKFIYSNKLFATNGLYFNINFINTQLYENKTIFNTKTNEPMLTKIYKLEEILLNNINLDKQKTFNLSRLLNSGCIKVNYNTQSDQYILKISGIWENNSSYGLTYKIFN